MMETLAELPFIGDQVVCLSHEPGARSGTRSSARQTKSRRASDRTSLQAPADLVHASRRSWRSDSLSCRAARVGKPCQRRPVCRHDFCFAAAILPNLGGISTPQYCQRFPSISAPCGVMWRYTRQTYPYFADHNASQRCARDEPDASRTHRSSCRLTIWRCPGFCASPA
jgi:hypothetical protein